MAGQPVGVQDFDGGARRRADAGNPEGCAAGRHCVVADVARRRGASPCRFPRAHPGRAALLRSGCHPDNESLPGVVIFRVEASLLYFNADHVRQVVWARIQATPQLRLVVCDLSDSPFIDVAGAGMLAGLHQDLAKRAVPLRVVEAHSRVRDLLRRGSGRAGRLPWPAHVRGTGDHGAGREPGGRRAVRGAAKQAESGRPPSGKVILTRWAVPRVRLAARGNEKSFTFSVVDYVVARIAFPVADPRRRGVGPPPLRMGRPGYGCLWW